MKKTLLTLLLAFTLALTACGTQAVTSVVENTTTSPQITSETTLVETTPVSADFDADDMATTDTSAANAITLNGDSIATSSENVIVNGSAATITAAGEYILMGTLTNGQIIVDSADAENVTLLLAGVNIHNESSAPIYVANAEKVIITLVDGTQNSVSDGATYANLDESGEPNAAIFSHDDLTINGTGALTVIANYNNGIQSKDDLKITGGNITVAAVNDGVKGKDSVAIKDGVLIINSGADGIQTTNMDEAEKGYIAIEGGTLSIMSVLDGIQAATSLSISGGDFTIVTGGGAVYTSNNGGGMWGDSSEDVASAKGLKATLDIDITGGTLNISSADDSVHANANFTFTGASLLAASGDDGMHADAAITINGGTINITQSYEGIESAAITINDGNIHLVASDDGLNVAGGADGSSQGGRPGQNAFADMTASGYLLTINGGYVYLDTGGDGLDSNGSFVMTGGIAIVNGPTNNGNGPLDYNGTFNISGGLLVAVGSSGMAQPPSETSSQYSVIHNFNNVQAAGTLVHIQDASGNDVLTFAPTKEYQSVLLSSPTLQGGASYTLYVGGTASGDMLDGLYSNTTYAPGTEIASFTLTNMTTQSGVAGGMMGGGLRGPGGHGSTPPDGMTPPNNGQP